MDKLRLTEWEQGLEPWADGTKGLNVDHRLPTGPFIGWQAPPKGRAPSIVLPKLEKVPSLSRTPNILT